MAAGVMVLAFPKIRLTDPVLSGCSIETVAGLLNRMRVSPDRLVELARRAERLAEHVPEAISRRRKRISGQKLLCVYQLDDRVIECIGIEGRFGRFHGVRERLRLLVAIPEMLGEHSRPNHPSLRSALFQQLADPAVQAPTSSG
jgi:hypothetical protein